MLTHLWAISPRVQRQINEDTRLDGDLWIHGCGLLRLAELLENELPVTLSQMGPRDLATAVPTLGRLLDLVQEQVGA